LKQEQKEGTMNETTRVLNAVENLMNRHLVLPSAEERDAAIAWTVASWVADKFDAFPRLYFSSSEYGSGKSEAMMTVLRMTRKHYQMVGVTPAVLLRVIDDSDKPPVLGLDEADEVFGKAGSNGGKGEVKQILNAGYKKGGTVLRARGQDGFHEYDCYAPVVLSGVGKLPSALMTRSVTVRMRKPVEGERFTPYRERVHQPLFDTVREALDKWSGKAAKQLGASFPDLPNGVKLRDVEVWEPLVAVADLAEGSDWGDRIRRAAVVLTQRTDVTEAVPAGTQLVKTLARFFQDRQRVTQKEVADELEWTSREVGKLAREMELHPKGFRVNGDYVKGFRKEDYEEMFNV
jgi:hypothetical protein